MLDLPSLTTRQFVSIQIVAFGVVGFALGVIYGIGGLFYDLLSGGINIGSLLALAATVVFPLSGMMTGLFIGVLISPIYKIIHDVDPMPRGVPPQESH